MAETQGRIIYHLLEWEVHKNIHKGCDRAEVEYTRNDVKGFDGTAVSSEHNSVKQPPVLEHDIRTFQEGRYISTSEAVWLALSFPLHHTL